MARYIALDWDHNQVHLVAATVRGGKMKVEHSVLWQMNETPPLGDAEAMGKNLRERLRAAGIAAAPVLVSLARERVILKDIRFPSVPEAEEPNIIRFQAVKELTDSAEDVIIDYIPVSERGATEQRALALIARKEVIHSYETLCHSAGLKLAAVTPRPYGTATAARFAMRVGGALTPPPEPVDAAVAVVTVNDKWAEFCVIRGEALLLARTLSIGPTLAAEIRRNVTVYSGQSPQRPVQAVYLSSGTDPELRQRLGDLIEVPIYPFDPFAGADVDAPGSPGGFSGVAGLLFAQAERGKQPVNFVDPRKAVAPSNPNNARILIGAALFMIVVGALVFTGHFVLAGMDKEVSASESEKAAIEKKVNEEREDGLRIKALREWGTPVWLDEMYDLTDRIPDVNVLRITSLVAAPVPKDYAAPKIGPGAAKANSPTQVYNAQLTVKGEFLDLKRGPEVFHAFLAQFKTAEDKDYYLVPPQMAGYADAEFHFTVLVKKRPPGLHKRRINLDQ